MLQVHGLQRSFPRMRSTENEGLLTACTTNFKVYSISSFATVNSKSIRTSERRFRISTFNLPYTPGCHKRQSQPEAKRPLRDQQSAISGPLCHRSRCPSSIWKRDPADIIPADDEMASPSGQSSKSATTDRGRANLSVDDIPSKRTRSSKPKSRTGCQTCR